MSENYPPRLSHARGASRELQRRLAVEMRQAWRALGSCALDSALEIAARAERLLKDLPPLTADRLRSELELLRAANCVLTDNSATALSLATPALKTSSNRFLKRVAATICRYSSWDLCDGNGAHAPTDIATRAPASPRHAAVAAFDLSIDAAMSIKELELGAAKRMACDALATAQACLGDNSTVASFAAALIAQLAYEEGDYRHCESSLQRVLNAPGEQTMSESLVRAYPIAARIALHQGDSPGAVRRLNEGVALAESRGSERLLATCLRELIHLYIDAHDLNKARYNLRRLERLGSSATAQSHARSVRVQIDSSVANARLLLAQGPSRDAEGLLRRLHREAVARKDLYLAATLELRLVEALQINGAIAESERILISNLQLGMSRGLFQTWIDGGPHVHDVLRRLYAKGERSPSEPQPFLRAIVRRLALRGPAPPNSRTHVSKVLLSARESDILQLMGRGLTNKHIARDLSIAPETVKSHAKSIFEKLQARSRTEAVARVSGGAQFSRPSSSFIDRRTLRR